MAGVRRVLAIGYSQTGQLTSLLESVLAPLEQAQDIEVTRLRLEPQTDFPFPWPFWRFFDTFPECVYADPAPIAEPELTGDEDFDLIVFSWQVWFLSPAMPAMAFLQHPKARKLLSGKPVVSLIGCRNMWLSAAETFTRCLNNLDAHLVDNVVLTDRAHSAATFFSTPIWMLTGHRGPFLGGLLPAAGIPAEDIADARRFGTAIAEQLPARTREDREPMLSGLGAVRIDERLIGSERMAHRSFRVWGALLRRLGRPNTPARRAVLALYVVFLVTLVLTVMPVAAIIKRLIEPFTPGRSTRQRQHYAAPSGESKERLAADRP